MLAGLFASAALARMSIGELEDRLNKGCEALVAAHGAAPEACGELSARCDALLPDARTLVRLTGADVSRRVPDLARMIRARTAETPVAEFARAPVVLYRNATEERVVGLWKEQLQRSVAAAAGLMKYDPPTVKEWMMAWVEGKKDRRSFFRAEQVRDCLKEARKLAKLLSAPREVVRISRGRTLFKDEFSRDLSDWHTFGEGTIEIAGGRLHAHGAGITMWCRKEFGNALVSFDYNPASSAGRGAGALFAYPGTPNKGKDYSASAGPMINYNYGIVTYHCSLYRGRTGRTNLRRTGSGLRMLSTVMPDPCAQLGRTYRVEFLKRDETMQVYADGKLIHAYVDAGVYGPAPARGRFGIRHFSAKELEAYYDDFQVLALREGN